MLVPQVTRRKSKSVSHSTMSNSLRPHGLQPTRLLCPWDSPGKNTGVGCHALLKGIFPTQGLSPGLPQSGRFFPVIATRKDQQGENRFLIGGGGRDSWYSNMFIRQQGKKRLGNGCRQLRWEAVYSRGAASLMPGMSCRLPGELWSRAVCPARGPLVWLRRERLALLSGRYFAHIIKLHLQNNHPMQVLQVPAMFTDEEFAPGYPIRG